MTNYDSFIEATKEVASDEGWEVTSYSGRDMYGATCLAVRGDIDLFKLGLKIGEICEHIPNNLRTRTDSMGREIVVYWPSIPYKEPNEDNEEEED